VAVSGVVANAVGFGDDVALAGGLLAFDPTKAYDSPRPTRPSNSTISCSSGGELNLDRRRSPASG
jgi:hypothetical protein